MPDLLAGAHGFDDLDPGPIEFGIMFGAYEHAANHNRCATGCKKILKIGHYIAPFSHRSLKTNQNFSQAPQNN